MGKFLTLGTTETIGAILALSDSRRQQESKSHTDPDTSKKKYVSTSLDDSLFKQDRRAGEARLVDHVLSF
jgi:hypothetical protein